MEKINLFCDYYKTSDGVIGGVQGVADMLKKSLNFKIVSYLDIAKTLNVNLQPNQYAWFEFSASCLFTKYLKQYEMMFKDNMGCIVTNSILGIFENLETPIICYLQDDEFAVKELYEKGFYDLNTFHRLYYGFRMLQEKTMEKAKKIVVSPQGMKDYGEAYPQYKEKFVILNNGIDCDYWRPLNDKENLRKKYDIPLDKRVFVFNGAVAPIKGWHIMADLIKHYKDVYFICIFKHPVDSPIKSTNVKIFYNIPPQIILELYNTADATINCSEIENDSLTCLESQACNVPLIVSKKGYYLDVNGPDKEGSRARNDFGMTVTDWSFEGFREAVDFMLDDLNKGREFFPRQLIFQEKRDLKSFKESWKKLIDEVTSTETS